MGLITVTDQGQMEISAPLPGETGVLDSSVTVVFVVKDEHAFLLCSLTG